MLSLSGLYQPVRLMILFSVTLLSMFCLSSIISIETMVCVGHVKLAHALHTWSVSACMILMTLLYTMLLATAAAQHPSICWPRRVSSVEALGHGSTAHLLAQAQQQLQPVSAQSVLSAAVLAADASAHTKGSCHYMAQGSLSEDACKCLLKAPLLAELHEWTSWRLLFEADLGSLSDFVEQKGKCCATWWCAALRCVASTVLCCAVPCYTI